VGRLCVEKLIHLATTRMDDQHTTGTRGRKRFRKLRIAWSVGWGALCLLLMTLWTRSYSWFDVASSPLSTISVWSFDGDVYLHDMHGLPANGNGWTLMSLERPVKGAVTQGVAWIAKNQWRIRVPYWLLAAAFGMVAGAPWIAWPRRFSLRTLLIATTLVAVGLGLAVYVLRN